MPDYLHHRSCWNYCCQDCQNLIEEHSRLFVARSVALEQAQREIEKLKRDLKLAETTAEIWKDAATIGYADVIQSWMNDVFNKAFAKGQRDMRAELAKINRKRQALDAKLKTLTAKHT